MKNISPYAKAIAGFTYGVLATYLAVQDNGVNGNEWLKILVAGLAGSGLIYAVPNKDPKALHQDESVQPPNQRGASALELVIAVVLGLVALYLLFLLIGAVHR